MYAFHEMPGGRVSNWTCQLVGMERTSWFKKVNQAVLGGSVVGVIEDPPSNGAADHGEIVGLRRVGSSYICQNRFWPLERRR